MKFTTTDVGCTGSVPECNGYIGCPDVIRGEAPSEGFTRATRDLVGCIRLPFFGYVYSGTLRPMPFVCTLLHAVAVYCLILTYIVITYFWYLS
jgi:hypothetical protein